MAVNYKNFAAAEASVVPFTQNPPKNGADVDGVLFSNLNDIAPSDESLMTSDSEGRITVSATKQRDVRVNTNEDSKFPCEEAKHIQNNGFELTSLNEEISNLEQQILLEEEALQSAEESINQLSACYALLIATRREIARNDEFLKATISEFYNAKITLAGKEATNNLSMDLEKAIILMKEIVSAEQLKLIPCTEDETNWMQVKEARAQYVAAIASMKSNRSVESIGLAVQAGNRFYALLK